MTDQCDIFDCLRNDHESQPSKHATTHTASTTSKQPLMREELFATWIATGLFICVVGNQLAGREGVSSDVRTVFDVIALVIGMFIILWAAFSYYNLVNYSVHKGGEIVIVLAVIGYLAYATWETSKDDL